MSSSRPTGANGAIETQSAPDTDVLGWRLKLGVIVPATNTIVEPEFHAMAVPGVTTHTGRFPLQNVSISSDADFARMVEVIHTNLDVAIEGLVPCAPDHIIVGVSAETFWDGTDGAATIRSRLSQTSGVSVSLGSDAARAALETVYVCHQVFGAVGITLEGPAFHVSRRIRHRVSASFGASAAREIAVQTLGLEGGEG